LEPQATGRAVGPLSTKPMGTSESPKISLVTTSQRVPSWQRSFFNTDNALRGLMLIAALAILGIVGLIISELMQRSGMAWHAFGFHFFFGSEWDPVS